MDKYKVTLTCTKVVEVDEKSNDPQWDAENAVIEGFISHSEDEYLGNIFEVSIKKVRGSQISN